MWMVYPSLTHKHAPQWHFFSLWWLSTQKFDKTISGKMLFGVKMTVKSKPQLMYKLIQLIAQ